MSTIKLPEYFDILDDEGKKTGQAKLRSDVHRDGDWHKAVHIWIVNKNCDVLLQKRSPDKDSNPNMWDISCAGHLNTGDSSLEGALRELTEELGVSVEANALQLLGSVKKQSKYTNNFINNEFNDVYLLRLNLAIDDISFQQEEISEIKYVLLSDFKLMIRNNDKSLLMHSEEFEMLFAALDTLVAAG